MSPRAPLRDVGAGGAGLWFNVDGTNNNIIPGYGGGDTEVSISSSWSASQVRSAVVSTLQAAQPGVFSFTLNGDSELTIKEVNPDPVTNGYYASVNRYGTSVQGTAILGGAVRGPTPGEVAQSVIDVANNSGAFSASLGTGEGEVLIQALSVGGSGQTGDVSTGILTTEILNPGEGAQLYGLDYYSVASSTGNVELADLNRDGAPDIIQASKDGLLRITLNTGDGTFGPRRDYFASAIDSAMYWNDASNAVSTADLNGDGFLDVVVGGLDSDGKTQTGVANTVSVFLNRGDGTLGSQVTLSLPGSARGPVALADVNGDGRADILQASRYLSSNIQAHVFLNQGDGSFGTRTSYSIFGNGSNAATGVSLADLDGDGDVDLVTPNAGIGSIGVRLNDGDGRFVVYQGYTVPSSPNFSTTLTDLNNDGRPDIVQSHNSSTVSVLLNSGSGTFGATSSYSIGDSTGGAAVVGDVNGDGRPDIVRASGAAIGVSLNNGSGQFGPVTTYARSGSEGSAAIGDVNGDGLPDIVQGGGPGGMGVLLNAGGGAFSSVIEYSGFLRNPVIADITGDGLQDIVGSRNVGFTTYANQGAGSFGSSALSARLTFSDARGTAKIQHIDLTTANSARDAIDTLEARAERISRQRGVYGSVESRLKAAASVIDSTIINYRSAESRIKDTDVAEDAASMVRLNILKQVGSSVLAQANMEPQIALRLLQGA